MGKHSSIKRLSSVSQTVSNAVDMKARQRIEHLYELTDEMINAYDEINEKYVYQIYRKYKDLKEKNKSLQKKLQHHHCTGCKCTVTSNEEEEQEEENENPEEEEEDNDDDDEHTKNPPLPSSATSSIVTRSRKKNPFIISDIEETQNFDVDDSRFNKNPSDNEEEEEEEENKRSPNLHKPTKTNHASEEESEEEEVNEAHGMARFPIPLQTVIRKKAKKNKNAKAYLLHIPRYSTLCKFLRNKSASSFDQRPSEDEVRSLIADHISKYLANDKKTRQRVRDELREIHRSYMRTFMNDPHGSAHKASVPNNKLPIKKSPM